MKELSLYTLISSEKSLSEKNFFYEREILNIKKQNKGNLDKYFEALLLSQNQICELKVSIDYIMSLKNKSVKRKIQLKYYKKLIDEKEKIHKNIIDILKKKIYDKQLYSIFEQLIISEEEIQQEYTNIASNNDLIIDILYKKFNKENKM